MLPLLPLPVKKDRPEPAAEGASAPPRAVTVREYEALCVELYEYLEFNLDCCSAEWDGCWMALDVRECLRQAAEADDGEVEELWGNTTAAKLAAAVAFNVAQRFLRRSPV